MKKKKTLSDELKKADVDQAAAYAEQMRAQKATGSGESGDKTRKEDEPDSDRLDKQSSDKQQKEPIGLLFFYSKKCSEKLFIIILSAQMMLNKFFSTWTLSKHSRIFVASLSD